RVVPLFGGDAAGGAGVNGRAVTEERPHDVFVEIAPFVVGIGGGEHEGGLPVAAAGVDFSTGGEQFANGFGPSGGGGDHEGGSAVLVADVDVDTALEEKTDGLDVATLGGEEEGVAA